MRYAFAVPGKLETPTGGYAYDRRIIAELGRRGFQAEVVTLGEGFPRPSRAVRRAAVLRIAALAEKGPTVIDGLAFGALPELATLARGPHQIALVHHPLALETGLTPRAAKGLWASERTALSGAAHVIATSTMTADLLVKGYDVPARRVSVAPPGTDRVSLAHGSRDGVPTLLSVGSLVPRKGHDVLVAALARLADLPWRLIIVGDPTRDPPTAAILAMEIVRAGLSDRITLAGAVSDAQLQALYRSADLFVLASRFEGYGMAYAEAIAYGLPVIGTRAGAIPDTVGGGAILVDRDDVSALVLALRALLSDPAARAQLTGRARAAAAQLPTWERSAGVIAEAIERVGGKGIL